MQLSDLTRVLEEIAPTRHAESWDNVGLIVGDPTQTITRGMLCIDYTPEVACEAAGEKCDAIVAYHPPIFDAIKRIVAPNFVYDAIQRGVALYSPHTALDIAVGGTNDMLADAIGLMDRAPLRISQTTSSQYKFVTFVPESEVEKVSRALFEAGAGRIGNYSSCSFRSPGTGTFFGGEGTNPSVGTSGKLEHASEIKLETVVPIGKIDAVIRALRESHSYEEPAFDLQQLAAAPEGLGMGQIGDFETPVERATLIERVKKELELTNLLVAGPTEGNVRRAAVCAGACGDMLDDAITQKVNFYLTGEMRHHDALKAARAGMTIVCTLHSNSERAVLKRLKARLEASLPELPVILSRKDRDPFQIR